MVITPRMRRRSDDGGVATGTYEIEFDIGPHFGT